MATMAKGNQQAVFGFADYRAQGMALAASMGISYHEVEIHRFPDRESRVKIPAVEVGEVIFCRSMDHPNDKLVEIMLAASTARLAGADRLTLVAPYLCYMRQDSAFQPGEAVSQGIIGSFLADLFDRVITVDPHLHRIQHLDEAIPQTSNCCLSAAPAIGNYLSMEINNPFLLGPDEESEQWVRLAAEAHGLDYGIAQKVRRGDREVSIELPPADFKYRHVVLMDDMVSTGRTLAQAAMAVQIKGATRVSAVITHGLFSEDALPHLRQAGIEKVWSTDSVTHQTNAIHLADLLAESLQPEQTILASAG